MSDEDVRRLIEEATKESLNQSFTEAGRKFIQAAEALEQQGNLAKAEELYKQAADAYVKAANNYRESKSFKNAAWNMCLAGDTYAEMADSARAIQAYATAANDLFSASNEYLMWGDDAETQKGTALAITASMLLLMVGQEEEAFQRARKFAAENATKIRFPATVRLSQIPQMLDSALKSIDINAFASAEQAIVTELKSALSNANAQQFIKYVDKGLDMAREILRGKLKVPKIVAHLELPVDMTFSEELPLKVAIENTGDGDAIELKAEWVLDDGLVHLSGDFSKSFSRLGPSQSVTLEISAKAAHELEGEREYQVLVRGSYRDMLNTEYTLQAGPGTLVLRDYKLTEKLQHDADVTEGRISLLKDTIGSSEFERAPLLALTNILSSALQRVHSEITEKELDSAKTRIGVVNEFIEAFDQLLGNDAIINQVRETRRKKAQDFAREILKDIKQEISATLQKYENRITDELNVALAEWDKSIEAKKGFTEQVSSLKTRTSDVVARLEAVYNELPTAATTDDPSEAARRTKIRDAIDSIRSEISNIRSELDRLASDSLLQVGSRPDVPEKVKLAKEILDNLKNEVSMFLEQKSKELE